MTDEELNQELEKLNSTIAGFGPEKDLPNKEWRRLQSLKREQEALLKLKQAREQHDRSRETRYLAQYKLLVEEKNMNPLISYLLKLKMRSGVWW